MGRAIQGEGLVASVARQFGRHIPMKFTVRNLRRVGGLPAFEEEFVACSELTASRSVKGTAKNLESR
jgi:hypothetical protein